MAKLKSPEEEEKVPEEEIVKKPEDELKALREENEKLKNKVNELINYIEEIKNVREARRQELMRQNYGGITLDPQTVASLVQGFMNLFNKPKTSELDVLLSSAETLNKLKEYLRHPIEEELIKNSLDLQKAALETQKANMEMQKLMLKGVMKQFGIEPEKPKSLNIKIPPEAFEHE
jgi:predicted ribosome quality control (RQC) complex YloA/Tae2 family protein